MRRILFILLGIILTITTFTNISTAKGNDFESKEPMSIEEVYKVKGYTKEVEETIESFERKVNKKILIPQRIPFEVKNTFAKIDENDNLSIHYVGRENKDVFQYAVKTKNLTNVESNNTLSNGEDIYINIIESSKLSPVLELIYKKQEFEYVMNMKMNDKYTKDDLIKTAESLKLKEPN